jgi:hypothetical protein
MTCRRAKLAISSDIAGAMSIDDLAAVALLFATDTDEGSENRRPRSAAVGERAVAFAIGLARSSASAIGATSRARLHGRCWCSTNASFTAAQPKHAVVSDHRALVHHLREVLQIVLTLRGPIEEGDVVEDANTGTRAIGLAKSLASLSGAAANACRSPARFIVWPMVNPVGTRAARSAVATDERSTLTPFDNLHARPKRSRRRTAWARGERDGRCAGDAVVAVPEPKPARLALDARARGRRAQCVTSPPSGSAVTTPASRDVAPVS